MYLCTLLKWVGGLSCGHVFRFPNIPADVDASEISPTIRFRKEKLKFILKTLTTKLTLYADDTVLCLLRGWGLGAGPDVG